jgi:hypothetical protein
MVLIITIISGIFVTYASAETPWSKSIFSYQGSDQHNLYGYIPKIRNDKSILVQTSDADWSYPGGNRTGNIFLYDKDGNQKWGLSIDGSPDVEETSDGAIIYAVVTCSDYDTASAMYNQSIILNAYDANGVSKWNRTLVTHQGSDDRHLSGLIANIRGDNSVMISTTAYVNETNEGCIFLYDADGDQLWSQPTTGFPHIRDTDDASWTYVAIANYYYDPDSQADKYSSSVTLYGYDSGHVQRWSRTLLNYQGDDSRYYCIRTFKIRDNNTIIIAAGDSSSQGGIFLYDNSGALQWSHSTDGEPSVKESSDGTMLYSVTSYNHYDGSSATTKYNSMVKLYAYDTSGINKWDKTLYNYQGNDSHSCQGYISEIGNDNTIIASISDWSIGQGEIFLYDKNGTLLWSKTTDGSPKVKGSPDGTMIYMSVNYNHTDWNSSPVVYDSNVKLYAFDFASGTQRWTKTLYNYLGSKSHNYYSNVYPSLSDSSLLVAAGDYSGDQGGVYWYDKDGNLLLSQATTGIPRLRHSEDEAMFFALASYNASDSSSTPTVYSSAMTLYGFSASDAVQNVPPVVTTSAASAVAGTSATLNGSINPNGLGTTYYFEYGTNTSYGSTTPVVDAGSGSRAFLVETDISDLTAGETYHFRIVAINSAGTSMGDDQAFTSTFANNGNISGYVSVNFAGYSDLSVKNATVFLQDTGYSTTTDDTGNFTLTNVPFGTYKLVITAPDINSITQDVSLTEQSLQIAIPQMSVLQSDSQPGDANGDNHLGIEDAIYILQILSGVR